MSTEAAKQAELAEANLKAILERTGYSHEVTAGQRKYGGPPPNWEGPAPGPGHEVFCGKIPKDVLEDELIPLFEKCGTIWDLRLMMDPTTKQCRSFCFVTFVDKSSVDTAVKQLDGYQIRPGKKLKVNPSIPNSRLFVGNIPKSKSKDDIVQEFSKVVEGLVDAIIYNVPDDPKKKNRGFTFLDFESHKAAAAAKKRLSSCRVFGCDIIVDWADPLEEPDEETMSKVKVLYVRNLKSDVTEAMLRTTFEVYGAVEKVKKVKDYGFVHFTERDSALNALETLNGTKVGDSEMHISLAKPPTDAKTKEKRKLQHLMLLGRGVNQYWGGGGGGHMMPGRMSSLRSRMRMPLHSRSGYYNVGPRYMDYYGGGMGGGYNVPYHGGYGFAADDYYCNYGGGYDDYGGYDEYEYYSPMPYGMMPNRGHADIPYQSAGPFGGGGMPRGGPGGGRGPRSYGGGTAGFGMRGAKRKAMIPGGDMSSGGPQSQADTKKISSPMDSWISPPIAQQPLGQTPNSVDGYGDGDWYQDTYSGMGLQTWS
jgi:Q family heterogeneous nuclear ribonucleoprotein R